MTGQVNIAAFSASARSVPLTCVSVSVSVSVSAHQIINKINPTRVSNLKKTDLETETETETQVRGILLVSQSIFGQLV